MIYFMRKTRTETISCSQVSDPQNMRAYVRCANWMKKESQAFWSSLTSLFFRIGNLFLSRSKFHSLSARPESALTAFYPFIAFNINPSAFKYQSISPFITISISHISRPPSTGKKIRMRKKPKLCRLMAVPFPIHSPSIWWIADVLHCTR